MDIKEHLITTSVTSANQPNVTAILWDFLTNNAIKSYKSAAEIEPQNLRLSGYDYLIAADSKKPLIHHWTLNNEENVKTPQLVLPAKANCIDLSPCCNYLAAGIANKLYIWQLCSGKLLSLQDKHYQPITVVRFTSDGGYLITAGEDGLFIVYDFIDLIDVHTIASSPGGQVEPKYSKSDHCSKITDVSVGNFGRKSRVVTVGEDRQCCLYTLGTGKMISTIMIPDKISSVILNSIALSLYLGAVDGAIYSYDLTELKDYDAAPVTLSNDRVFGRHAKKVTCLAVNHKNTLLASGSEDCLVKVWSVYNATVITKLEHKGVVTNLIFVLNSVNFSSPFTPKTVLCPLERNLEPLDGNYTVSVVRNEELEFSESDGESECKDRTIGLLQATNQKLYEQLSKMILSAGKK